jgi:hypothetical protein
LQMKVFQSKIVSGGGWQSGTRLERIFSRRRLFAMC